MKDGLATFVFALVLMLTPAAAAPTTMKLGNLTLAYDDARWDLVPLTSNTDPLAQAAGGFYFFCKPPACGARRFVWANAEPIETARTSCVAAIEGLEMPSLPGRSQPVGAGLRFRQTVTHGTCRAYTPTARRVCAEDTRFIYSLGTGGHFGCHGTEGVPEAMFSELLAGISIDGATTAPEDR